MIGVISVSMSAIFVKLASAEAGIIAFYRMLFSVLIMAPWFLRGYTKELTTLKDVIGYFLQLQGFFSFSFYIMV